MSKVFKVIGKIAKKILPKAPNLVQQAVHMPDPESLAAKLSARKKLAGRAQNGRDGTIYSGGTYSGANLGGTA